MGLFSDMGDDHLAAISGLGAQLKSLAFSVNTHLPNTSPLGLTALAQLSLAAFSCPARLVCFIRLPYLGVTIDIL